MINEFRRQSPLKAQVPQPLLMKPETRPLLWALTLLALFSAPSLPSAYYDPGVQRWINRDPLAEGGFSRLRQTGTSRRGETVSLYCMAHNDPLNKVDPLGLFLGWGYGNWCGYSRSGPQAPIDDVDAACKRHDYCLATWEDVINPCKLAFCNYQLCYDVKYADCSRAPDEVACLKAKATILTACPAIVWAFR
jgi:RHS repeat-associated protein